MRNDYFHSSNIGYEIYDSFYIGKVVYVCQNEPSNNLPISSCCVMLFVTDGIGTVELDGERQLYPGNLILLPPFKETPLIKGCGFITIRFRGGDTNELSERFSFSTSPRLYDSLTELIPLFASLKDLDEKVLPLRAKGLLYYALSCLPTTDDSTKNNASMSVGEWVKNYIDENFTDPNLSLTTIGDALSYHKNYISKVFNERYEMSISKYINILRVKHAHTIIESGEISVKEICNLVGFTDTEYFSAVFKSFYNETPKELMKRIASSGTTPQ